MRFHLPVALLVAVAVVGSSARQAEPGHRPAGSWQQYRSAAAAGWDELGLQRARAFAESAGADAVLVVHRGRVVVAWGEVTRPFKTYSVRKSLAGLLIGQAVDAGQLDPGTTLAALDIDDEPPLTAVERRATVRHLLQARSGVYHTAAREPPGMRSARPARGSQVPGAAWFYNNWDFNTLSTVFGRATGVDLLAALRTRLAVPLGFEDFEPHHAYWVREPAKSRHFAYEFMLSARDLARVGQLVLQDGRWDGRAVVSSSWLRESFEPHSPLPTGGAYGYLWWIDAHRWFEPKLELPTLSGHHHVAAQGNGGQMVLVLPSLDLVIVTLSDLDHHPGQSEAWAVRLVDLLLRARTTAPREPAPAGPLRPEALPNPPPPTAVQALAPVSAGREPYLGRYAIDPNMVATVSAAWDGLFIELSGRGQLELFADGGGGFVSRTLPVRVAFDRGEGGEVTGLRIQEGARTLVGRRQR